MRVNDSHGHLVGDRLLVELAERLQARLRREDLLARLGGDEFAVIAVEASDREAVERVAAALFDATRAPFSHGPQTLRLGVSIGAVLADGRRDGELLLQAVDAALYRAKAEGRNRSVFAASPEGEQRVDVGTPCRWTVARYDESGSWTCRDTTRLRPGSTGR